MSTQAIRPPDTLRAGRNVNGILTSGLASACHYAAARPDCQVLAIRYARSPCAPAAIRALHGVQAGQQPAAL